MTRASLYGFGLACLLQLGGCGCGFDCNNGNNNNDDPATLTLGLSDALPEDLKQLVIEVNSVTFRRAGVEDVVVDQFTIDDVSGQDSFQVDLLQYRGRNQLVIIENLELPSGSYSEVVLDIIGDGINHSYAQESDDSLKPLTVSAQGLSVSGMTLESGEQIYTVEFSLAQSLQFLSSTDSYLLSSEGVRIQDNATAASLSGRVDSSLFDTESPCDAKEEPTAGNRIYLYVNDSLDEEQLVDVFTSGSGTVPPDEAVAPFAVAALAEDTLTGSWRYAFGFLPAGSYTLAFACDTASDDAVEFDDLTVPLPTQQIYRIELSEGEKAVCDLGNSADCNAL